MMIANSAARPAREVSLWVPGDWNAFFGLFTNVLLNVLVLTGLVLGVVKLPDTPGIGMDLDNAKIESQKVMSWSS